MICDQCGGYYRRVTIRLNGSTKIFWKCGTHQEKACNCPNSPRIPEQVLHSILMDTIRREYLQPQENTHAVLTALGEALTPSSSQIGESALRIRLDKLQKRKKELLTLSLEAEDEEALDAQLQRVVEDIREIKDKLVQADQTREAQLACKGRLEKIEEILESLQEDAPSYDDVLIRKAVASIRVRSPEELLLTFKDGKAIRASLPVLPTRKRRPGNHRSSGKTPHIDNSQA